MQGAGNLGDLQTGEWQQLEDLADRLEKAWEESRPGSAIDLGQFLPPAGTSLRRIALPELVKTDLEIRWRRGQTVTLEFYLEMFPELGTSRTVPAQLIYEEYRVRQLYGDHLPVEKYRDRFPEQYAQLTKLLKDQPLRTVQITAALPTPSPDPPTVKRPKVPVPEKTPAPASAKAGTASSQTSPIGASQGHTLSVAGGYKFIKRIGAGNFGEVWRAEAPGGVEVAVKMILRPLDQEDAQRELQSLETIKNLRHPFLLATQAYWPLEDRLYIVMELAEGCLRDRVKQCRTAGMPGIPLHELYTYFQESAEALDYLHKRNVQHRDVKPENILIVQGHAKVADFGLAKMMQSQRMVASATSAGTPVYMAPEVWRGNVSQHSDQYSLAMAYAELRLNRRLFQAGDMMAVMFAHLEQKPDLSPLAEPEQEVILKALEKDPQKRYESCLDFMRALKRAIGPELRKSNPNAALDLDAAAAGMGGISQFGTDILGGTLMPGSQPGRSSDGSRTALAPGSWHGPGAHTLPRGLRTGVSALAVIAVLALGYIGWGLLNPAPVERAGDEPKLPANCRKDSDEIVTVGGKKYYPAIVWDKDGMQVPLRLIAGEKDKEPPFYIMETKVWNDLFQKFASEHPDQVKDQGWKQGYVVDEKKFGIEGNGKWPVLGVRVDDANRFAQWMGGLLPSVSQWEKAAGCTPGSAGPFRGHEPYNKNSMPPEAAVDREKLGPLPVGEGTRDIGPFGCKDMAGNGLEWTRSTDSGLEVQQEQPTQKLIVYLRGRSFAAPGPLEFPRVADAGGAPRQVFNADIFNSLHTPTEVYDKSPQTDISFRVVLEPR